MAAPIPVWSGVVDGDGRLRLESLSLFRRFVAKWKGQPVSVVVRKQARPKSQSQMGYWHGIVIPILAEHFGYAQWEHDAVHDAVVRRLRGLKPDPNPLGARVSMAEMSLEDVSDLIEDCRHWALTEHGVVIPDAVKAEAA